MTAKKVAKKKAPAKKRAAPRLAAALEPEALPPEPAPPQAPPQSAVTGLDKQIARIKVIAGAAVTWLVAASTTVTIFSDEIVKVVPDQAQGIGSVSLKIVAWLGAAIAIIRRVTPVIPEDRGILPQNP